MMVSSIGPEFPQVIAAAQEGAEWAWSTLYHTISSQLAGFARGRGAPEPEDVVGEVMHDLARNIQGFSGNEANFRSWAFKIAHDRMVDQWRKRSRNAATQPAAPIASAESQALAGMLGGPARSALARLTSDQQTVMLLRAIGDFSLDDVAEIMGKNVNAIKALQHRAVRQLRNFLEEAVTQ